jgi:hypothetical protein
MWLKWLPWKIIVRQTAQSHGFIDPIKVLSHLRRFAQPSEGNEPVELMRAGALFHARGFMNSRIIQHNLDWVWPSWVVRQFSPSHDTFIPRAFSLTHVNLSGRNWTAFGVPGDSHLPIVDPCGLLTPLWDGWSIDAWVASAGRLLAPSRIRDVEQRFEFDQGITIRTCAGSDSMNLESRVWGERVDGQFVCRMDVSGTSDREGWLILSLRPYNPEGVSFIHSIELDASTNHWTVNEKQDVWLDTTPDTHKVSVYQQGDVSLFINKPQPKEYNVICDVGMATAAAFYRIAPGGTRHVRIAVPLAGEKPLPAQKMFNVGSGQSRWQKTLDGLCRLDVPDERFVSLYDAAVRSSILHSPLEIYPGPFTYKRFWFRDAAFILQALIHVGLLKMSEKLIDAFLPRQTAFGYFHSQEGEWDSNGQVLWIMNVFCRAANMKPEESWLHPIVRGASWIVHKRVKKPGAAHDGLLPAGFSAEHLGPNDFYYWDDFWSVAGLRGASEMLRGTNQEKHADEFARQAEDLLRSIENSLQSCRERLNRPAIPASPYRRLDSGAIGSLAAGYPMDIFTPEDERLADLADYLFSDCVTGGGFFHDIIHSGINPYLTLHLAQVFMRAGDQRFVGLIDGIAKLASPTGQWPEAINPRTATGCMGDGQHIWSASEWIVMMVRMFVYEQGGKLIIGAGLFPRWLRQNKTFSIGPVHTVYGPISINVQPGDRKASIRWQAHWHNETPQIEVRIPGCPAICVQAGRDNVELEIPGDV